MLIELRRPLDDGWSSIQQMVIDQMIDMLQFTQRT